MRQIYPVQNSKQSGFTLIEVLIAVVVVALTTAAAASAIILSQKLGNAAAFDQNARSTAVHLHALAYGLVEKSEHDVIQRVGLEIDQESIHATDGSGINWNRYRLRQTGRNRSVSVSIAESSED